MTLDAAKEEKDKYEANPELTEEIDAGYYQVGTLGGGNHFIELQIDGEGFLGLMLHSAAIENHYGKNVWVHRKGAIRARIGDIGIIPGAMGSYSYIVEGLGNDMSFHSSSHGAGRRYSRTGAMAAFSTESVMLDLKESGVVLGKHNKNDVAEESRFAYKDIDEVMENQKDLVKPIKRLKTIGVVKG